MFNLFKQDREKDKDEAVNRIVTEVINNSKCFDHEEQTEILNRATLRIFERKRETRTKLIEEARQVQESLTKISLPEV